MTVTRRRFLRNGLSTALALVAPRMLHAEIEIGEMRLDVVSDGSLTIPGAMVFQPVPQDELASVLSRLQVDAATLTPPCNVTLLRGGGRTVLFDVGSGPAFQPTAGALPDGLAALGVAPEDVTDVIFTHAHPDHLWGVLDDFGDPLFSQARHMIGQQELDYWTDPDTVETIGAERQAFAVGAARRLKDIEDRLSVFRDGDEVLPGITARATFGHTPGHMSFELASGNSALMIVGDSIGNDHIALARPDWKSGMDQDMDTAVITRVKLLDEIASREMPIVGYHLTGGLGRVERSDDGYLFRTDL